MSISTPEQLKDRLHQSLNKIRKFEHCALLDRPGHCNLGDHLIWLGEIFYLTDVLKTKINYTANIYNFSSQEMEQQIGTAPILLSGGGNLGDLWTDEQEFREQIITQYPDRPIIILPQTIYFTQAENLSKTAKIFNQHPDLTLFVRDERSHKIAAEAFYNCQVISSPDMALHLVNMPELQLKPPVKDSLLFLCREDRELKEKFDYSTLGVSQVVMEDWAAFKYKDPLPKIWTWPGITRIIQELQQQGVALPYEWISRQLWKQFHPNVAKLNSINNSELHRKSWNLAHHGFYQFSQHRLVITNRLHGHILCLILKIPHVFLPNAYYKNESFYEAWTAQIPFCRFVKQSSEINAAIQELLELFPR
ncbi:polysaccharide pyruvyl transferase family protein [Lyngbya aestuarii]|uniref:polysaccharide pyruvyl transferase family protein n=1 Tax=Lyngbya aestuarii TaxID=118322 RepID=UPI00403E2971